MFRFVHAKRVVVPLVVSMAPILASSAGCDWVDKVDHVSLGSGDGGDPPLTGPTARFRLPAGSTTAPDLLDVPFPSDVYLANGRIVSPIPGLANVIPAPGGAAAVGHDLGVMNGFSRIAMSLFYIDDPANVVDGAPAAAVIDTTSLPASESDCVADGSSVFLIDLQASDPSKARVACRAQFHVNERTGSRSALAVGPARGVVLEEGHKYAAVLTNRVKLTSGGAIVASADFDRIRKGDGTGAAGLYVDAFNKATSALGSALSGAEIIALAPFTTNSMTDELFKLREAIDANPEVPDLKWEGPDLAPMTAAKFGGAGTVTPAGFTATLDAYLGNVAAANKLGAPHNQDDPSTHLPVRAHDKIASVGTAVFEATNYLQDKGGYTTIDHATFKRTASGELDLANPAKTKIWVTFTVPTGAAPTANGFPTVILQHGLGGSREYIFALANALAAKGYITVAIDSVTFGARAASAQYHVDKTTASVGVTGNDATYKLGDGIADVENGATDLFGTLINIGALRDQMRQAALDTAQLVRVLSADKNRTLGALKLPTDMEAPKIDPTKIAYLGNSLGGIQGATAAAIEPNIHQWVLNVAGGGLLIELATHSPNISQNLKLAAGLNFGLSMDKFNESHPLVTLLQTIADPGDPLNYAGLLVKSPRSVGGAAIKPRNILQIEVVYDELVPNEANEALARAGGWGLATPNVGSNAGISDIKTIANNPGRVPLPDVAPGSDGFIKNTPVAGVTVVQTSPSQHGSDWDSLYTKRSFSIPYGRFGESEPFPKVSAAAGSYTLGTSYLRLQSTVATFLADGFAGDVPRVNTNQPTATDPGGFKAPIRDVDGDGVADDVDPDPNDPTKK